MTDIPRYFHPYGKRCLALRKIEGQQHRTVTVAELHARLGVNATIVSTYVDKIQPKPSPIVIGRFGVSA